MTRAPLRAAWANQLGSLRSQPNYRCAPSLIFLNYLSTGSNHTPVVNPTTTVNPTPTIYLSSPLQIPLSMQTPLPLPNPPLASKLTLFF